MDNTNKVLISVIIPVKNGQGWIRECLEGIIRQTLFSETEIIILDSGSTDQTGDIISHFPVRVINVPPSQFNHGLTRNLGVLEAKGEFVVMTVQDARPMDEKWLENLLAGFIDDSVAGVCGGQAVPHDIDKNPVDWYFPMTIPSIIEYGFTPVQFKALSAEQKQKVCGWDNVNAMYRKDALKALPFRKAVFGEDAIWAMDALLQGYKIVYHPLAKVYHYHDENRSFVFKRHLTTMYFRFKYFEVVPSKPTLSLRRKLAILKILFIRTKNMPFKERIRWWNYNIEKYRGILDAYKIFCKSLAINESVLDEVHEYHCGIPPMAVSRLSGN